MESDRHKHIKLALMIIIGVLLLVLGIVIGLLIAGAVSDRPLGSRNSQDVLQSYSFGELKDSQSSADTNESNPPDSESGLLEETLDTGESGLLEETLDTGESGLLEETLDTGESEAPAEVIRIVLDPGHDDICSRNHPDLGFNEQDLNLKIAQACRDELNTYEGVEVFLTREDGSCPDNGVGSDDVTGRTAYAESVDADLFVSIHNNATGLGYPSEANGAEVYISVHSAFTEESRKLGESILTELTTQVGLADRGVLTRVKPEKGYYEDGNVKDWYYLISTSVERGFPGIIIEHAFMDNPHDNAILKDDVNLAAMGVADAQGIAKYFNLKKK